MEPAEREVEPYFSQPVQQIFLMLVALGLVLVGGWLAFPAVAPVFLANPYLNGFIFLVFVIGVIACFIQVLTLISSVQWIKGFATNRVGHEKTDPPQLLAPLAALLKSRGARMQLGSSSTRSILDSVGQRIDEVREITRYIVNLLIFLGLLGTFYGLATTVPALVETIRSLTPKEGESAIEVFGRLQAGLESQLDGMGVAFASSLLGLAGSLVIGLLEIFAGQGQNRFYRELEEWLSTITRVSFSDGEGGTDASAMTSVLDHMAEQMEALQMMFTQSDVSRGVVDQRLAELTDEVRTLTRTLDSGQGEALRRVAEGQEALIARMGSGDAGGDGIDAESRMRLRSIDVQLLRILEEISAGRQESITELRGDLANLTRAMRQGNKPPKPQTKD